MGEKRKKENGSGARFVSVEKQQLVYLFFSNTQERRWWTSIFAICQRPLRKKRQPVLPFCSGGRDFCVS